MRIVIGVDGSSAATTACELVASRTWPIGTRVSLTAALEPVVDWTGLAPSAADTVATEREALELALAERATALCRSGLMVETAVDTGRAAAVLMACADAEFADLIVVGSRGLGPAASAVFGSVSAELVDHARCPVLVARSPSISRMLLATDGTLSSRSIPRVLAAWRDAFRGVPVEVLSVAPRDGFVTPWAPSESEDAPAGELALHDGIARAVADEMIELGWHAAAVARLGEPSRQIIDAGRDWDADLIVTGSRGIGTLRRLLGGSVAHDVLLHARSSVLVVRGQVPARIGEQAGAFAALSAI
ncbi:MAG TPA: universal stress protein [Candidatus Limnocylindria bacterium]|nr:universal stress protein [Candidatus Limnocylindria bacterium]